jgi:hypothetical protein
MWSRRTLLSSSAWALATQLGGCGRFSHPDAPLKVDDPRISNPKSPLTIDVHAHVFNGTDIPIERYLTLVRARTDTALTGLGEMLEEVVNAIAPDGEYELKLLRKLNEGGGNAAAFASSQRDRHRAEQYERGVRALKEALAYRQRTRRSHGARPDDRELVDAINNLPDRYVKRRTGPRGLRAGNNAVDAALQFAEQQFNYRYVNTFDYLEEYGTGTSRKADLALCHMLDFDWALSKGLPPRTTVRQQIQLTEQLSILSGGRIHGYAPFDPYKQVAFGLGLTGEDSLSLVQWAVQSKGHIGVKMYPPMGFAPFGNKAKSMPFWDKPWIADALKRPDLGGRLDSVLEQLYAWCVQNEVPIMAHTSPSNMPDDTFCWATDPARWQDLPVRGLRVNFGHFGDTELGLDGDLRLTRGYADLMSAEGTLGANFFADSAYLTDAVRGSGSLANQLTAIFKRTRHKGPANLANRLMYGSDWEMLLIEPGDTSAYLRNFENLFTRFDKETALGATGKISDAFFGANAARYLGLGTGNQCRKRLDQFYAWHGIQKPLWAIKVDCLDGCRAEDKVVLDTL